MEVWKQVIMRTLYAAGYSAATCAKPCSAPCVRGTAPPLIGQCRHGLEPLQLHFAQAVGRHVSKALSGKKVPSRSFQRLRIMG